MANAAHAGVFSVGASKSSGRRRLQAPEGVHSWNSLPNKCTRTITVWAIWLVYNQIDRCVCINYEGLGSGPRWLLVPILFVIFIERIWKVWFRRRFSLEIVKLHLLDFADNCGSGRGTVLVTFPARKVEEVSCPGVKECTYLNVPLMGHREGTVGTLAFETVWKEYLESLLLFFFLANFGSGQPYFLFSSSSSSSSHTFH